MDFTVVFHAANVIHTPELFDGVNIYSQGEGIIIIDAHNSTHPLTLIRVYDITGKLLSEMAHPQAQQRITAGAQGVLLVQLIDSTGKTVYRKVLP
jgi:hypothetical protein